MKAIPFSYIARNLWVRRVTTLLTAGGMALVVFVFATVLMMGEGIRATLVATGQSDNVLLLRKGAGAEINSGIERGQAAIVGFGLHGLGLGEPRCCCVDLALAQGHQPPEKRQVMGVGLDCLQDVEPWPSVIGIHVLGQDAADGAGHGYVLVLTAVAGRRRGPAARRLRVRRE